MRSSTMLKPEAFISAVTLCAALGYWPFEIKKLLTRA